MVEKVKKNCHIISKVERQSYCYKFPSQIILMRLSCGRGEKKKKTPLKCASCPGPGKADTKELRWPKVVTGDQGLEPGQSSK